MAATFVYASEADLLNIALFGMTAKEWREHTRIIGKDKECLLSTAY
ncbi:MAG: hypothetical protein LBV59_09635 [Sphingobacterium sp.]|jgi:hypothetical protein|nr:hypothetical protein [Sphingobacterium sp.]MDR3008182.1 hypothetical protein [Sphingobacterium sp.]